MYATYFGISDHLLLVLLFVYSGFTSNLVIVMSSHSSKHTRTDTGTVNC